MEFAHHMQPREEPLRLVCRRLTTGHAGHAAVIHVNTSTVPTSAPMPRGRCPTGRGVAAPTSDGSHRDRPKRPASGIVNDPNDWATEVGDPRYIIDLLRRIITVSLELKDSSRVFRF
jgi:hypothetical protein